MPNCVDETHTATAEEKKDATTWVVIGSLCLTTVGLIGVTWFAVSGLQENSEKLREYKAGRRDDNEKSYLTPATDKTLFGLKDTRSKVHRRSVDLAEAANKAMFAGDYQTAIATMRESIKSLEDDVSAGNTDGHEDKLFGSRYAIITVCYLKLKDGPNAVEAATKSLKYRPDNVFVLNRRADAWSLANDAQKSAVDRTRAGKLEAKMPKRDRSVRRVLGNLDEEGEEDGE